MDRFDIYANACRRAIPEGITLLETDGALPLKNGEKVALFGRGQFEYVKSGTGSGGRVNCAYVTNISEELEKRVALDGEVLEYFRSYVEKNPYDQGDGWTAVIQKQEPFDEALVQGAAARNDKAIYVLCRSCGESYDYKIEKGNWFLTDEEEQHLSVLSKHFRHLIVLVNSGNLIDMNWVKTYGVGTVAFIWQGGQEGGVGTVDALMGDVPPSGRLPDTIAKSIEDYPAHGNFGDEKKNVHVEDIFVGYRYFETFQKDRVLYPFGYGLNYTQFSREVVKAEQSGDTVSLSVRVKNVGAYAGKEVVQVYCGAPSGKLGKPARVLVAFEKTALLAAGEEAVVSFDIDVKDLASYDDCGATGYPYAYVLEAGEYKIFVGENVRAATEAVAFTVEKTRLVRQCTQALAPVEPFERMKEQDGALVYEPAPQAEYAMTKRVRENLPAALAVTGDCGITLKDVFEKKNTLDEFVAQFDEKALMQMVRGEGMSSPKAPVPGTASCFAGVTEVWNEKNVPVVTTCDGPSGVRMENSVRSTCIPSGTLLSSGWGSSAFDEVFDCFAEEMLFYGVDVILAPGMNIHRHPLCGRSFEYYSEDPYLAGKCAAQISERFYKKGGHCTLKHFAVNSQELNRLGENEVLSERALREIYLKGFEIAVKNGYAKAIMTSYNRINGVSAAGNYDLTTTILRGEWGYDGMVMTDWWTQIDEPENGTFSGKNLASMVKAQNDVYMVMPDATNNPDDLQQAFESGDLTIGELQRCAKNLLRFSMTTLAFREGKDGGVSALKCDDEPVLTYAVKAVEQTVPELGIRRFFRGNVRVVDVNAPEEKFYCGEIAYAIDGDVLEQHSLQFCVDRHEPIVIVCSGTNGEVRRARFKIYLKKNSNIAFGDECISEFSVYNLK